MRYDHPGRLDSRDLSISPRLVRPCNRRGAPQPLNGRITDVEVYFGWSIPHEAPVGTFVTTKKD
jgi:hypothetical protein